MRSQQTFLCQGLLLPVLGLALLLLDSLGDDLLFHQLEFDSYEITIPKKLSFWREEQGVPSSVAYLLQLAGKKHIIHLWPKKLLLPQHLRVFSFTEEGQLLEDHPYIPKDCNYMGLVEGFQDSDATLSTCMGGLRGVLSIDAKQYQIEPLKASSTFEHVVYLLKDEVSNQTCGLTDDETERQMAQQEDMARISDYTMSYKHQKYLELVMIFDTRRFEFVKQNLSLILYDAILLTGIIDTYYQDINMRIHLKGIEVWRDEGLIRTDHPALADVLKEFIRYRKYTITTRITTDWVHLYISRKYIDALALSWGRVCSTDLSGSISTFLDENVLGPATWTAHELGHSVGMLHDKEYCQCRGRKSCIMGTGRTGFSNCSYELYFKHLSQAAKCLNDIPQPHYINSRCGNRIIEQNEECDCGSIEECEEDLCCRADCKLKLGANCSVGLCCDKCNFLPSGYVCRDEENECDLPEYCYGNSDKCPADTYKQDGTPCSYEGRCYNQKCRSRYMQCQSIFGPDAREAPSKCYEVINIQGDQYGHCAIEDVHTYIKCKKENAICGRLQCINVKVIPDLPDHTIIMSTHLEEDNIICWGTGYHLSMHPMGIPDIGMIYDGTSCGEDQVCFKTNCVNSSVLKFDCVPEKCNGRGVCNANRNCHCMYGWDPPFCEEFGYGGSIDSGPPGPRKELVPPTIQVMSVMLLRLVLFIISAIIVCFRQLIVKCLQPKPKKPQTNIKTTDPEKETNKVNKQSLVI
ncbi:disintegrin and metalloproteinase domain-containing protein 30 [Ictidomys tridecemlineatus]|uniref:disintegrin and metalloproteinase domain-containing protein 30 isoform X1 n=1 Tax=Ictidomys tridecemlineatus TaxID=43179 RepID=UPI00038BE8C1|nr:disintegrin and metalloproteinase domain-containing protein 30 isoform X1 [Ictidomys tridecemlineatus]KAG3280966.1 ADAM metallopeptidase domain 30 [Ictidomys tridecemlineatus]